MSKQQSNREKRYQAIIDSAERLFIKNSWETVQMQHIADAAGIGVATLFRYFPKKELVIIAVAEQLLSRELGFFHAIQEKKLSGFEKIEAIFHQYNRLKTPDVIDEAKFIDRFDANIGDIEDYETAAAKYFEIRKEIAVIVKNIVQEGQADGSLPQGASMMDEIMTMINNFGLFARKLALMNDILELEATPDAKQQLSIIHDMYMVRLRS
ncbi:TetR/AcrR family transcriptional regulator [Salinicoccus roseus]|uniref:TetR/AcrR family transcriptional regulator n=1 Tax=Salinicoccus roseus TaxID=45670 RepID=UPI0023012478|nr:TetR/AcrR family transcriptional regulator [Salinicoccus roseus]